MGKSRFVYLLSYATMVMETPEKEDKYPENKSIYSYEIPICITSSRKKAINRMSKNYDTPDRIWWYILTHFLINDKMNIETYEYFSPKGNRLTEYQRIRRGMNSRNALLECIQNKQAEVNND